MPRIRVAAGVSWATKFATRDSEKERATERERRGREGRQRGREAQEKRRYLSRHLTSSPTRTDGQSSGRCNCGCAVLWMVERTEPWAWPDGFLQNGFRTPKWCERGPFRIRTPRCRLQNRVLRPRKNIGLHEILTPFWEVPPALPEGQSRARCVGCCKILTPEKRCHHYCPAQLGLGPGQTDFCRMGFGHQNGVNGVRFGYVQPDAGFKIRF